MAGNDLSPEALLDIARNVLQQEAQAIRKLADQLGPSFLAAVTLLHECKGMVVVTGMGKAGLVGAKPPGSQRYFAGSGCATPQSHDRLWMLPLSRPSRSLMQLPC